MDQTVSKIIGAIQIKVREQLQSLGDFPKADPFEHGVQVGTYQGLDRAISVIEQVLTDVDEEDARR